MREGKHVPYSSLAQNTSCAHISMHIRPIFARSIFEAYLCIFGASEAYLCIFGANFVQAMQIRPPFVRIGRYRTDRDLCLYFVARLSHAARIALVLAANSASCERVFSFLESMFGDAQMSALSDYIQTALMLQYNSHWS